MTISEANAIRFRGRSYFALTLTPEAPLCGWLKRLDACLARSPGFFCASPVILDLEGLELAKSDAVELIESLAQRGLRILGLEGASAQWCGADLPPAIASREARAHKMTEISAAEAFLAPLTSKSPPPLIIEEPVRSGQCVTHATKVRASSAASWRLN